MAIGNNQKIGEDKYILVETGNLQYEINEYDSLTGVYVYATKDSQYSLDEVIASSNYSFQEITGTNYIIFDAGFPLDDFYSFKLIEPLEEATRQSSIVNISDITPENLNKEFDNSISYLKKLQDEMNKKELRIDGEEDVVMLPKLDTNEFWLKTETGYRATDFSSLEKEIQDTFNDFFGIIGGVNAAFTFNGVTSINGNYVLADGPGGIEADGIALQSNGSQPAGTFFVLTGGFSEIPTGTTDDAGDPLVTDTYYYQSPTVPGGFTKFQPVSGVNKKMFKTSLRDGVLWALFQFHPLEFGTGTVDSDYIKYYNSIPELKDDLTLGLNQLVDLNSRSFVIYSSQQKPNDILLDNGFYASEKYENQFNFKTVTDMLSATYLIEEDRVKLWGHNTLGDGKGIYYTVSSSQNTNGILLNNGFYANPIDILRVGNNPSNVLVLANDRDAIRVERNVKGLTDCHAFADGTVISDVTDYGGYGVFDSTTELQGSHIQDHIFSFQDRVKYTGDGTLEYQSGLYSNPSYVGTGTVGTRRGVDIRDCVAGPSQTVNAQQGVYIANLENSFDNIGIKIDQINGFSYYAGNGGKFFNKGEITTDKIRVNSATDIGTPFTLRGSSGTVDSFIDTEDISGATFGVVGDDEVGLGSNGFQRVKVKKSGLEYAFTPNSDNSQPLGDVINRWKAVYAGTGTIQTSDEREKTQVRDINEIERNVAIKLKEKLKAYKWKDMVSEKGEEARWHFGIMAQEIKRTFESEGLNAYEYGMFCYDEWEADEDKCIEAGNRYGVRYEELLCFIISSI